MFLKIFSSVTFCEKRNNNKILGRAFYPLPCTQLLFLWLMARLLAPFLWVPSYFHSLRLCLLKSILRLQVIIASLSVFFAICSLSLFLGSLCLSSLVSPYRNSIQGDVSLGLIPGITGCLKETPFILIQQNYHIFNM